ncbi:hypothetical protein ACHAQA_004712 [Verticillium albo-atrum]
MSGGDKSLLDRLNALKGSSGAGAGAGPNTTDSPISLDPSANALNVSIGVEPAKPPSREDALAARLRSLRNTPERDEPPAARATPLPSALASQHTAPATPKQKQNQASTPPHQPQPHDVDPLLHTDDQTLEELLQDEHPGADPRWTYDPKAESARVEALLDELSKGIPQEVDKPDGSNKEEENEKPADADEDTDGEEMNRDVETLLAQALDEAELDAKLNPQPSGSRDHELSDDEETPAEASPRPDAPRSSEGPKGARTPDDRDAASPFSLPSVPSAITPHKHPDDDDDQGDEPSFSLPSVPSGPATASSPSSAPADEDSLAARMAALRLPTNADIGLPSVPSEMPANRLRSRTGYTDDDARNWCTVCLEDATLRCLGCDEDGYCSRCWREMHVGPAAAFDDRTHKAVLLGRDPKPRRVALGA